MGTEAFDSLTWLMGHQEFFHINTLIMAAGEEKVQCGMGVLSESSFFPVKLWDQILHCTWTWGLEWRCGFVSVLLRPSTSSSSGFQWLRSRWLKPCDPQIDYLGINRILVWASLADVDRSSWTDCPSISGHFKYSYYSLASAKLNLQVDKMASEFAR